MLSNYNQLVYTWLTFGFRVVITMANGLYKPTLNQGPHLVPGLPWVCKFSGFSSFTLPVNSDINVDFIKHGELGWLPILSGWWFQPLLKNMKVSWDDYSQYMESHNPFIFQSTNQWLLTMINHHYPILNQRSKPPTSYRYLEGGIWYYRYEYLNTIVISPP